MIKIQKGSIIIIENAWFHYYNNRNTVTKHAKGYLFVLIDKAEKNKWQNYYKVSDYYIPENK